MSETITITREVKKQVPVTLPAYFKSGLYLFTYYAFIEPNGIQITHGSDGYSQIQTCTISDVPANATECTPEEVLAAYQIAEARLEAVALKIQKSLPRLMDLQLTEKTV